MRLQQVFASLSLLSSFIAAPIFAQEVEDRIISNGASNISSATEVVTIPNFKFANPEPSNTAYKAKVIAILELSGYYQTPLALSIPSKPRLIVRCGSTVDEIYGELRSPTSAAPGKIRLVGRLDVTACTGDITIEKPEKAKGYEFSSGNIEWMVLGSI